MGGGKRINRKNGTKKKLFIKMKPTKNGRTKKIRRTREKQNEGKKMGEKKKKC